MTRLIDIVAPRSRGDAVLRGVVLLGLVVAMDLLFKIGLGLPRYPFAIEVASTVLIALPFVIPISAVLLHQRRL